MPSLVGIRRQTSGQAPDKASDDEAALVDRARHDRQAFAPLYLRYVDPVYRYCYRRLGTKEAAEDATSLIFMKALAALPHYKSDGPSFRSWLFSIAHNVITDDLRSRHPSQPLLVASRLAGSESNPEEMAVRAEAGRTVRALLAQLPADQARLLEMRLAGLTAAEIAAALGSSPGAVRVAHHRAVARVRSLLGDRMEETDA